MASDPDNRQLDLTESITEVPQASSLSLFIALMEALRGGERDFSGLAPMLEVDERTVRYYADFGRWLTWLRPAGDGKVALTAEGLAFVESIPARGRLFSSALFSRPLVQTVQQLKRDQFADLTEPAATRRACERAVEGMTTLSEATAARRASSLASMLRWAYHPRRVDWSTGQPEPQERAPFDFRGQSFLTAFAARQYGRSRQIYIGFPHQVVTFATGQGDTLQAEHWVRASYDTSDGSARWYGSIPINPSTLAVARRGGPDLRRLLVGCNPYLSILVIMMVAQKPGLPSRVSLTRDMYGLRLWYRDRELGSPLAALATIAGHIDLIPIDRVPHLSGRHVRDDLRAANDEELAQVLTTTGIVRSVDTSLVIAPGVASELRLPVGDGPTLWERAEPLREALQEALLRLP